MDLRGCAEEPLLDENRAEPNGAEDTDLMSNTAISYLKRPNADSAAHARAQTHTQTPAGEDCMFLVCLYLYKPLS